MSTVTGSSSATRRRAVPGQYYWVGTGLDWSGEEYVTARLREASSAQRALQGRFVSPPTRHDGTNRVKVRVAFSEPVEESPENVGAHGVEVEGGQVTSVSPVRGAGTRSVGGRNADREDREVVWELEIEPDSDADLTVSLHAGRPCGEPGAICTADGRSLSEGISTTVEGPDPGPPPLTARFVGLPEAHDGTGAFRFRVAFSEAIGISYRSLREDAFTVTAGRVTRGKRVDGRRDLFEMMVEPDGDREVTVTLSAGRECSVSGAICTRGENRRQLTNAPTATVAGPAVESGPAVLTARFADVPSAHDAETAFTLRIAFSDTIRMSGRRLRSDVVAVSGGRAAKAGPMNGRKDLWRLKIRPDSLADVMVTLSAGAPCGSPGAVCTADGRALASTVSTTVRGPVGLSVADARAMEGEDKTVDFVVSLSRAASGPVTVAYRTVDGTARAGEDYARTGGTLRFAPGETGKTVSVPVLDDLIDEGKETFTLRLDNASGARIADATAIGTIENSDPLQRAWLSRFGRTVGSQVVDAVSGRLRGAPAGSHVTVAGQRVGVGQAPLATAVADLVAGVAPVFGDDGVPGGSQRLAGTAFHLGVADAAAGPQVAAWGRVALGRFDAEAQAERGTLRLDGAVTTAVLGADVARDRWLAGLALSRSEGRGTFEQPGVDSGRIRSTLTSVSPYVRFAPNDRLSVWGLVGHGAGDMTIRSAKAVARTDLSMRLGALGTRGALREASEPGGLDLALRGDAFWIEMESATAANTVQTTADASRVRVALEASRSFELERGRLTPSFELGLRHDDGDPETGAGLEAGAGLRYVAGAFTVEGAARTLVVHEASGYEEWGLAGSVRLAPGASGRGLSVRFAPVWGAPSSGAQRLWSARDAGGLARTEDFQAQRRFEAEVGYGIGLSGTRGLVTPYTALSWTEGGTRTHRTGARWQVAPDAALGLEWTHGSVVGDGSRGNAVTLQAQVRW